MSISQLLTSNNYNLQCNSISETGRPYIWTYDVAPTVIPNQPVNTGVLLAQLATVTTTETVWVELLFVCQCLLVNSAAPFPQPIYYEILQDGVVVGYNTFLPRITNAEYQEWGVTARAFVSHTAGSHTYTARFFQPAVSAGESWTLTVRNKAFSAKALS